MDKIKKSRAEVIEVYSEHATPLIQSAISALPYVGGIISTYLSGSSLDIHIKRTEEFFEQVKERLEEIEEGKVDKEYIESVEFYYLVKEIFIKVATERDGKKLQYFRNLFINGIINEDSREDFKHVCIQIMEDLTASHLEILMNIVEFIKENDSSDLKIPMNLLFKNKEIYKHDPSMRGLINRYLLDLEDKGLISQATVDFRSGRLTQFGVDFIKYMNDQAS